MGSPAAALSCEAEVDRFLDTMTTQNKFPFSTPELRAELKHTFWLLNRVDGARALAEKAAERTRYSGTSRVRS